MRRPRRPMRRRNAPFGPSQNVPKALRLLRQAHHMMERGRHSDAAAIFEQLAREAHDRGKLQHVPNLYLQAARANLLAGQIDQGNNLIREGLGLLAKNQRWRLLHRSGERVIVELQGFGFPDMAAEIEAWLQKTLPEPPENYRSAQLVERGLLPLKCPYCGGVLHPDDVEMLDEITGECPFCGSSVRKD